MHFNAFIKQVFWGICFALYESTSERCTEKEKLAKETAVSGNFVRWCEGRGEGSLGVVYNFLYYPHL